MTGSNAMKLRDGSPVKSNPAGSRENSARDASGPARDKHASNEFCQSDNPSQSAPTRPTAGVAATVALGTWAGIGEVINRI